MKGCAAAGAPIVEFEEEVPISYFNQRYKSAAGITYTHG